MLTLKTPPHTSPQPSPVRPPTPSPTPASATRYHARLNGHRKPSWETGQDLGITKTIRIGDRDLSPRALSYATLHTVTRFCHSADPALADHHVPRLRSLENATTTAN
ncbi:hypothetical protein ACFWB9_14205 [Streptomyces sp. NPDC060022]